MNIKGRVDRKKRTTPCHQSGPLTGSSYRWIQQNSSGCTMLTTSNHTQKRNISHTLLFSTALFDQAQTFINLTFRSWRQRLQRPASVSVSLTGPSETSSVGEAGYSPSLTLPQPRDTKEAPGEYNENENQLGYGLWRQRGGFVHRRKRTRRRVRARGRGRGGGLEDGAAIIQPKL